MFGDNINILKRRYTFNNESIVKQYYDSIDVFNNEYAVEKIENGFRGKKELIPLDTFREAIAKSLVHRTWDIKASTKVEMHPD